jgi:hypothetical protein
MTDLWRLTMCPFRGGVSRQDKSEKVDKKAEKKEKKGKQKQGGKGEPEPKGDPKGNAKMFSNPMDVDDDPFR